MKSCKQKISILLFCLCVFLSGCASCQTGHHSVSVGVCSKCNQIVGQDLVQKIGVYLESSATRASSAALKLTIITDYDNFYDGFYTQALKFIEDMKSINADYDNAIELCGNIPELRDLKASIIDLQSALPLSVSGSDHESFHAFTDDVQTFSNKGVIMSIEYQKVLDLVELS